ncbi:AmmeMemoRadiSam system radical SAM enzyme [Dethiosulfovibrio sp. F2B]|uniref:AmmeMemoRadiSam system radical SAM enzyme n=1 Tax=Dethiosulfovibrio faecalis TaxID=2720018 RepID=UPI001F1A5062|nr:AmmeMemoRadiSam system radical SAM enzyme [Dethiosulfovibrio faecalis]MCF4151402.1 AmmeMemoRadiSam system radical SAM enzyme [Dethiosulfovibrio faecalis]
MKTEALWWHPEGDGIICDLCPHSCFLKPGDSGFCSVRKNEGGVLMTLNYGETSSVAIDPVEKKPLFHWHPGEPILSLGSVGCSMNCPFCQNWRLTRFDGAPLTTDMSPSDISNLTDRSGTDLVAFTYNEPLVSYEFLIDVLPMLREKGKKTVLVTNGQIAPAPLEPLLPSIDCANVDLKAFDKSTYTKMGGSLDATKSTIETIHGRGIHLEISWLVVPGISDDLEEFERMLLWLNHLDPAIPLHINRYYPAHRWDALPTDERLMDRMADLASSELMRVYQGNRGLGSITRCLSCGAPLVTRAGYRVDAMGLLEDGRCSECGAQSDIIVH